MNLVIVESPAKAKTINKYLGDKYLVLASYGHIRDLPSKNGSVDPENKFQMEWEIDSFSKKYLKEITNAAEDSDKIILATDPDREGEAIAWHVKEVLDKKKLLKDKHLERVVFNEITKKAILDAIKNPREIHLPLVEAYLARRALDYLVGFNISPILWTKLPGSKSAGRVQSVALKLITEREKEIELFKPEEYWTLTSDFTNKDNKNIFSKLSLFNGEKIDLYDYFVKGIYPNVYLRDQDVILVDAYLKQVDVSSGLKTNALYELKENETVEDVLSFAGGFSSNSYKDKLFVNRIDS